MIFLVWISDYMLSGLREFFHSRANETLSESIVYAQKCMEISPETKAALILWEADILKMILFFFPQTWESLISCASNHLTHHTQLLSLFFPSFWHICHPGLLSPGVDLSARQSSVPPGLLRSCQAPPAQTPAARLRESQHANTVDENTHVAL